MARKARPAPSDKLDLPVEAAQPPLTEVAPAPRRSRKPKAATPMSEPVLPEADNGAGADAAAPTSPMANSTPARRHPGRKPHGLEEAAAVSLVEQALAQQPEADTDEPAASGDDVMIAEMAYPVSAGEGSDAPVGEAALPQVQDGVGPDASSSDASAPVSAPASAKPAAQWDRATDAVRFDWPAIERTAAQDGPNQAMAKLLVAARAEGANARWPL